MLGHRLCFVLQPRQTLLFPDFLESSRLLVQGHTETLWHGQELQFGAQFPALPALGMKSELLLLCLHELSLSDSTGDPSCPRFHTEIWSEPQAGGCYTCSSYGHSGCILKHFSLRVPRAGSTCWALPCVISDFCTSLSQKLGFCYRKI